MPGLFAPIARRDVTLAHPIVVSPTSDDCADVPAALARVVARAHQAGFRTTEIDAARGDLVHSFLSLLSNASPAILRDPYGPLRAAREPGEPAPWPADYLRAAPLHTTGRNDDARAHH